jgi:steroid delta-isomerase-like uncharacterized protein
MSEMNKNLVRRCLEGAFNQGDMSVIDQCIAADYVYREPVMGEKRGKQGWKEIYQLYKGAFPDCQIKIDEQVAEGDKVVTRWTARGTQRGPLLGIAPTNKSVTVQGILISRIRDGKIVEDFETYDALGMFRQLGAMPGTQDKAA